jgi:excisionase family DNA binding protein
MIEKACRSGQQLSASQTVGVKPVPVVQEEVGNLPSWALQIHQEADSRELPRRSRPTAAAMGLQRDPPALMSVKEAAMLLHVSAKTIRRLIERGELRAVRIGRSVRLRSVDVSRIISE